MKENEERPKEKKNLKTKQNKTRTKEKTRITKKNYNNNLTKPRKIITTTLPKIEKQRKTKKKKQSPKEDKRHER